MVTLPPLAYPGDLEGLPGSPFSGNLVDIACASVRGDAGWHIAPVVTETVTLTSFGGTDLQLPSRRVLSVTAVRDVTTGTPYVLTGWSRYGARLVRTGVLGWPAGTLEVDLSHGYESVPMELLPLIAARINAGPRDPSVAQRTQSAGPFSETLSYRTDAASPTVDPALQRYALLSGVA